MIFKLIIREKSQLFCTITLPAKLTKCKFSRNWNSCGMQAILFFDKFNWSKLDSLTILLRSESKLFETLKYLRFLRSSIHSTSRRRLLSRYSSFKGLLSGNFSIFCILLLVAYKLRIEGREATERGIFSTLLSFMQRCVKRWRVQKPSRFLIRLPEKSSISSRGKWPRFGSSVRLLSERSKISSWGSSKELANVVRPVLEIVSSTKFGK